MHDVYRVNPPRGERAPLNLERKRTRAKPQANRRGIVLANGAKYDKVQAYEKGTYVPE